MKNYKNISALAVVIVFIVIDVVLGKTYSFMDVSSMIYLAIFILILAGIYFLDRENYKKFTTTFSIIAITFLLVFTIGGVMSSKVINAKRYANVIGDVQELTFQELYGKDRTIEMAYVDKASALLAAEKKLGELSDVSSRFKIDYDEFSQINFNDKMVRVAPFEYTDTFKKYTNIGDGIPYYVKVITGDGVTNAKADLVTLEKGMKYYPGAPFLNDLHRHVALKHKFSYLDDWYFEIDDAGHPYWLVQVITKRVGIWGAKDMAGLIVVDAINGDTNRYNMEEIPEWVDSVYPTDMLLNQARDHYELSGGFINSVTQQRGVMAIDSQPGDYNYVMIDDEIYIFTGIRPQNLDSSSTTGLLFMSKRTGKAIELDLPGISLPSAENTSIGAIQEKNYAPTTPVLQNVGGFPTYVMALKDNSGVVRGFSHVNYQDYTKSSVGDTIKQTEKNYLALMGNSESLTPEDQESFEKKIELIQSVIIDGNSLYYMMFEGDTEIYNASILVSETLAFAKPQDMVKVKVEGQRIIEIKIIKPTE